MKNLIIVIILLFLPLSVYADDKKKKEVKKIEKGEFGRKKIEKNPLKKILKLLNEVENRMNEADTGEWTQQEQRDIIEALKLQSQAKNELDRLIENLQKSGSGSGGKGNKPGKGAGNKGGGQGSQKKRQKSKSEQQKEKKQQESMKKERELESLARKKLEDAKKKIEELKKKAQSKKGLSKEEREELKIKKERVEGWGNLPLKLHQDVEKARMQKVPDKYRDMIEGYRKRIND